MSYPNEINWSESFSNIFRILDIFLFTIAVPNRICDNRIMNFGKNRILLFVLDIRDRLILNFNHTVVSHFRCKLYFLRMLLLMWNYDASLFRQIQLYSDLFENFGLSDVPKTNHWMKSSTSVSITKGSPS